MAGLKSSQYTDQSTSRFSDSDEIGEVLKTSLSGNAQHHRQTLGNWLGTIFRSNQILSGSPASWDCEGRLLPFATLSGSSSITVNLSNVRSGSEGVLIFTKTTTADITITLGGAGITNTPSSFVLSNSTINTTFKLRFSAVTATDLRWEYSVTDVISGSFTNGLGPAISSPSQTGWGGTLIEDTTINGASSYSVNFDSLTSFNMDQVEEASSIFSISSTTKGFLGIPRMTEAQRDLISTPATGLQVYNTDTNSINYYNGSIWTSFGVVLPANEIGYGDGSGITSSSDFTRTDDKLTFNSATATSGVGTVGSVEILEIGGAGSNHWKWDSNGIVEISSFGQNSLIISDFTTTQGWTSSGSGLNQNVVLGHGAGYSSTSNNNDFSVIIGNDALIGGGHRASTVVGHTSTTTGLYANVFGASSSAGRGSLALARNVVVEDHCIGLGGSSTAEYQMIIGSTADSDTITIRDIWIGEGVTTSTTDVQDVTMQLTTSTFAGSTGANFKIRPGIGVSSNGSVRIEQTGGTVNLESNDTGLGFFATSPIAKPTVSGSTGGNAALQNLLTELSNLGLITDSTT